uniref:DUF834 domain-containing protein n=1 Tax=Oryza glaberrima TaxID=4538 RepID=I1Q263_ORYGL
MAAPSFLTMGPKSEPQLVVVVEERECAAWTRAMRMPRRGRVGTTAAGDGGRGVIVLAIGYHRYRCRCHWETRDKGLGAALVAMATRPLDSTPPAEEKPHWRRSGDGDMMVVVGVSEQRCDEREEDGRKKEEGGKE